MTKSWAKEAADEIIVTALFTSGDHKEVSRGVQRIIIKHAPFKPEVAYMEVPRCDACKWWDAGNRDDAGRRECGNMTISPEQLSEFMTMPNFGCVKWEKK